MNTLLRLRRVVLVLMFLTSAALSPGACSCSEDPYINGECSMSQDCQSIYQNVPGTICVNERCVCEDPTYRICCAPGETEADCFHECRPCSACRAGTLGCSEEEETTGCQSDAECPGPPDPRCGEGSCVAGECTVEIRQGPLTSQVRGDCWRAECSATGEVVMLEEPSDIYNDGEQCTHDVCGSEGPRNEPLIEGTLCPETLSGQCHEGRCVECYAGDPNMNDCPTGSELACEGTYCVVEHCVNLVMDFELGETSTDCGGPCAPCDIGRHCKIGSDCLTRVCAMNVCKAPTCSDNVQNDAETGVDCGTSSCPQCPPGDGCDFGDDCTSGVCWAGVCEVPTCFDGVRNGGEAGIDCGGPCEPCP